MNIANGIMIDMRLVHVPVAKTRRNKRLIAGYMLLVLFVGTGAVTANAMRPLPKAAVQLSLPAVASAESLRIDWPAAGQAAIAAEDYDLLATHGSDVSLATASIAKIITALCVLQKYPLTVGQSGPVITLGKQDVALYQYQLQNKGSNVAVYDGEQMTEYEALEAMLIPSANNIADSLAVWAFESLDNYALYANSFVLQHGLVKTHIGVDASGLDPSTVSSATDLAKLGLIARAEPVIMSIAAKTSTTIPNVGKVYNYNSVLGINGINGLKTGNNDQNRGALLFTANIEVAGKIIAVSGAVLGQPSLPSALDASTKLVASIAANFEWYTYAVKGQTVGVATTAWGKSIPVKAAKTAQLLRWRGDPVTTKQTIQATTAAEPEDIGAIDVAAGLIQTSVTLQLDSSASGPNYWWRASRL